VFLCNQALTTGEIAYIYDGAPQQGYQWTTGGLTGTISLTALRSDRAYVRNASPANPAPGSASQANITIIDAESATNSAVTYTVSAVSIVGGVPTTGAGGVSNAVTITASTWWAWIPNSISTAVPINRASKLTALVASGGDASLEIDRDEDQGQFTPFGRPDTLVVHGDMRSESIPGFLGVITNDASWAAFDALRNRQQVIAIRSDMSAGVYFMSFGPSRPQVIIRGDRMQPGGPNRQVSVDFVAAVRPAP
jgi:hypothetical protein